MADSNQEVVQTATTTLTAAITTSGSFANWIGWQSYNSDGDLQKALNIVAAIEQGNFTLDDLFLAAQNKTGVVADIGGPDAQPNPTLTVLGYEFEIGSLLGETKVDSWTSVNKNSTTTHLREYFETVGVTPPDGYDAGWNNDNDAPVAETFTVSGTEVDENPNTVDVNTLTINLLDPGHVSDADGDALTVSEILIDGQPLPSYITDNGDGTLTVDLNSTVLDDIHLDDVLSQYITYKIEDGNGGETTNTVTLEITGTADQYHGTVDVAAQTKNLTSGQTFSFDLALPENDEAFDFSGTVTVTVAGDFDANNENALVLDGGEIVDVFTTKVDNGLLYLEGANNPTTVDGTKSSPLPDGAVLDNTTLSGSSAVAVGGFDGDVVEFDVTLSGQVGVGSTVDATLNFDFWM